MLDKRKQNLYETYWKSAMQQEKTPSMSKANEIIVYL